MQNNKQDIIANTVKKHRIAMGYTQQELADISNISLRSIQRIEKGHVIPRMHTLKVLAEHLGFPLDFFVDVNDHILQSPTRIGKMVLNVGAIVILIILAFAYLAQSPNFPETTFELLIFSAVVISGISILLYRLFK